ncbi:hypothetical protein [Meiothermus sp. Pnk-1]|uniref:hypothetical protein n=1 Tax=Meiothermus sp. Pnk-1 TaxID=873128 RepID=UPI001F38AEC8|nr:hypothetical protein [Meiothermus sp. Pnk-1]
MRAALFLPWLMGLALAQGVDCSSVPPSLIPTLSARPTPSVSVSPGGLAAPGSFAVQADARAYVASATLSVRGEQRWGDYGPQVLASWGGSPTATANFGPLAASANGTYTFTLSAQVCYRLNGAVVGEELSAQARVPVFIPWTTADLPWFLWKEAEAANYIKGLANDVTGGQPMFVEGLVTGLAEPVRAVLRDYLVKGYLNQGNFPPACAGWCYAIAPVQLRLYAVQGVGELFQQGWASLGLYGGQKDSRSYELGTKGVAGVLVVRGYRHDYILLSARGDFSDATQVIEMPKGASELFRKALSLSALQQNAREVRP